MKDKILNELREAATGFLACRHIAVAGVSRAPDEAGNLIYRRLRSEGYQVYAINPQTTNVEDDPCYPNLATVPARVEAIVITTPPEETIHVVEDCIRLGIGHLWIHRSFGHGSLEEQAVNLCKENHISVIPGGCPMMFLEPIDMTHRCMRWLLKWTGGLPEPLDTLSEEAKTSSHTC